MDEGRKHLLITTLLTTRKRCATKKTRVPPKLTDAGLGLLTDMERGHQLETDSLGGDPILRRSKDDEVICSVLGNIPRQGPVIVVADPNGPGD